MIISTSHCPFIIASTGSSETNTEVPKTSYCIFLWQDLKRNVIAEHALRGLTKSSESLMVK
jgi:hypothetical protein